VVIITKGDIIFVCGGRFDLSVNSYYLYYSFRAKSIENIPIDYD